MKTNHSTLNEETGIQLPLDHQPVKYAVWFLSFTLVVWLLNQLCNAYLHWYTYSSVTIADLSAYAAMFLATVILIAYIEFRTASRRPRWLFGLLLTIIIPICAILGTPAAVYQGLPGGRTSLICLYGLAALSLTYTVIQLAYRLLNYFNRLTSGNQLTVTFGVVGTFLTLVQIL